MSVFIKIRRLVMKKFLTSMLFLALAGSVVLSSCADKNDEKKKNEENQVVDEVTEEISQVAVPEEQLDFEFEINTFNMEATITGYVGEKANVVVPDTITDPVYGDVVPVTKIGTYAFAENETIVAVKLPETVTDIEKGAFQSCPQLRAVALPVGLKAIDDYAFYNSNKIEKLGCVIENEATEEKDLFEVIGNEFPSTVESIGFMAFSSQLNEIAWYKALTDDVVVIGDGILLKFNAKKDYTIDEGVKSVAYYAFSNVGPVKITVTNPELELDDNAVFMSDKALTFVVPADAKDLASAVKLCGASYEFAQGQEETQDAEA